MRVILPKKRVSVQPILGDTKIPLFFLAGPILGGGEWQTNMCRRLMRSFDDFYLATPSVRYGMNHALQEFHDRNIIGDFERQLSWERHYLELAAYYGCIIFWLPCESIERPRDDGLPYAMDTRGELGEWRGRLMHEPHLKVVIGAEANFPGLSQIQRNFNEALSREFPIYPTLEATAEAAAKMARAENESFRKILKRCA